MHHQGHATVLEVTMEGKLAARPGYVTANAINTTRKMYRDPHSFRSPMFDRRVARGSTVTLQHVGFGTALVMGTVKERDEKAVAKRAAKMAKKIEKRTAKRTYGQISCDPPIVTQREPEPVDLSKHLEEQIEVETIMENFECQTDIFIERPETPPYVPAKTGMDATTQIEPTDLWDYDLEVWPVLDVVVNKTLEQALIEVFEEEELARILEAQRRLIEHRDSEVTEKLRLEEVERLMAEERDRRIREFTIAKAVQKETEERVAASVLAHGYMADLLPDVLRGLEVSGHLLDEIREFLEMDFLPELLDRVGNTLTARVTVHDILTTIVREIQETNAVLYRRLGEETTPSPPLIPREVMSQPWVERDPSATASHTEIKVMGGVGDDATPPEPEPEGVKGKRLTTKIPADGYKGLVLRPLPTTAAPAAKPAAEAPAEEDALPGEDALPSGDAPQQPESEQPTGS